VVLPLPPREVVLLAGSTVDVIQIDDEATHFYVKE